MKLRTVMIIYVAAVVAACGAGGSPRFPEPDEPQPLATGTASLSGTVDVGVDEIVQEREPNDRIDEMTQFLARSYLSESGAGSSYAERLKNRKR